MPVSPLQFNLDLSGINPNNLIENETHNSIDVNTGILIPKVKNFFTESFIIKDANNQVLQRDIDYVFIEFNQNKSLESGKEICNAIIFVDSNQSLPLDLTYQVLGGLDSFDSQNLIDSYISRVPTDVPVPFDELTNKPDVYNPKHHLHDADEIYGLEYIVKKLARIEKAIRLGSFSTFKDLLNFIDTSLINIRSISDVYLDTNMSIELSKLLDSFTKEYLDLDKVKNLLVSSEKEGSIIGDSSSTLNNIAVDKYVIIDTLIGFKKSLYLNFIRKEHTGLDLVKSTYTLPYDYNLRDLPNGSIFNSISKTTAQINTIRYSDDFYPSDVLPNSEVVITKLSNSFDSGDGDYIMIDKNTSAMYWGISDEQVSGVELVWKRIISESRLSGLLQALIDHQENISNPHELTKEQILLDKVENLPVATKEELDTMQSVRSYLTFDTLLYWSRKHLLQNGPPSPVPADSRNKFIIDNCVVVYSPGGKPSTNIIDPKVTGLDGTFVTGLTIGWSVNNADPGSRFTVKSGLLGMVQTTKEYIVGPNGNFVGFTQTGNIPGVIQSLFQFKGGKTIMTNSLIQLQECGIPPPPPPPAPTPPPPPPLPAPVMMLSPTSVIFSTDSGELVNVPAGVISNGQGPFTTSVISGVLPAGLSVSVSVADNSGHSNVSITGTTNQIGVFLATIRIQDSQQNIVNLTVNSTIAASKVPDLTISSNRTVVRPDTSETITVTATGGKPNSSIRIDVQFNYRDGSYKTLITPITINLDAGGSGIGTCPGGNPGAKIVSTTSSGSLYGGFTVTYSGGLPFGNWAVTAKTVNTTPIKQSNTVVRFLSGLATGGNVSG